MPELPEVETMVRGIRPEIKGRVIEQMEYCRCTRKPIQMSPGRRTFQTRVNGATVVDVHRLAKRVVVQLDTEDFIVVEPRMTGLMLIVDPPSIEHRRICWKLQPKRGRAPSFEFWDRRGLGTVRLLDQSQLEDLKASLGCDALTIDVAKWHDQLKKTSRPVKVAMLDQKLVAGIGNLYASEILHRACVSPRRAGRRLTKPQVEKIAAHTREVLQEAIRYEGSTLSDGTYRNALNKDGGYQNEHRVYAKEGEACPSCDNGTVKRIVQAQRSTFYCSRCQK